MNIKARLFATLREGRGKEVFVEMDEGDTVQMLIDKLDIPNEDIAILLVNGLTGDVSAELDPSDVVSIFPPTGGG